MKYCYVNAALSLALPPAANILSYFAGIQVAGNSPKAEQHACNRGRAAVINIPTNIKNIMKNESISMLQNHNHCNGRDRLKYWQIEAAKFRVKMAVKHLIWCNSERLKQIIHIISSTGNEKSYCPLYPQSAKWGQKTPQLLAKITTCWPPLVLLVPGRPTPPLRKQTCRPILFSTSLKHLA